MSDISTLMKEAIVLSSSGFIAYTLTNVSMRAQRCDRFRSFSLIPFKACVIAYYTNFRLTFLLPRLQEDLYVNILA